MPARKRVAAGKTRGKLSQAAASRLADKILKDLQSLLEEAADRKQAVNIVSRPDLIRKLRGQTSHSPFLVFIAWNAVTARGSTTSPSVGVFNPDPTPYSALDLFAHAFWGPGNVLTDLDAFVLSADPAFPRLAVGIDVPAGSTVVGTVNILLPTAVAAGTYMMNWLLFLRNPFGVGTLLERAGVFTTLT